MKTDILDYIFSEEIPMDFQNNSYQNGNDRYSRALPEFLAWVAALEDFVVRNYGLDSALHSLYQSVDKSSFFGNAQYSFEREVQKLRAVLTFIGKVPARKLPNFQTEEDLLMNLFLRFHNVVVALRKRHGNRSTLSVLNEYDVQDLLRALLTLYFKDVRTEEWTPSYAGGSARMDFLLKVEKIVIEVKMSRESLVDRELGNQLIEDIARYRAHPDCQKLICFVYDPQNLIVNPEGIQNDLNSPEKDFSIKIVIAPHI